MRSKYLILVFICVLAASIPATSTIFDLGNYTIDTGAYETPPDAGVSATGALQWSWSDKEKSSLWWQMPSPKTTILIENVPDFLEGANISRRNDNEYMAEYMTESLQISLVGTINGMDDILDQPKSPRKLDSFENESKNLTPPVFVDKPYPGYITISSKHPTFKVYVGAIDKFNLLVICSSESDERMALIMSELKVYPKEESNTARLQAIQKMGARANSSVSNNLPRQSVPTTTRQVAGTRDNPIPIGTAVNLGDGWQIVVLSVAPSATNIVMGENSFNDPPKAGYQFFLARVRAKYTGAGSGTFGGGFRLRAVGPSSVGYSTFENSPGVIPDPLPNSEVFSGGVIEGNIGWEIKSSDASSLVMYDNPISFGGNEDRIYMALY